MTDRPVELGGGLRDYLAGDTIRDSDYGGLELVGRQLVAENTKGRLAGLLGEPRVNVLALNLALDSATTR